MTRPFTHIDVDAAVRAVLAERGLVEAREEVFSEKLFGQRHLATLPRDCRELRVAAGTVVTPLARDELKRRGIVLTVAWSDSRKSRGRGTWGFAIEGGSGVAQAFRTALLQESNAWREIGDSGQAIAWVAAAPDRAAIAVVPEASVVTWRACSSHGVRAATVGQVEAVARAVRHLGANFLVVEPAGQSIFTLKQMAAMFRRRRDEDRRVDRPGDVVEGPSGPAECALRNRLALAARGADGGLFRPR
jgi:hypothetical protein